MGHILQNMHWERVDLLGRRVYHLGIYKITSQEEQFAFQPVILIVPVYSHLGNTGIIKFKIFASVMNFKIVFSDTSEA